MLTTPKEESDRTRDIVKEASKGIGFRGRCRRGFARCFPRRSLLLTAASTRARQRLDVGKQGRTTSQRGFSYRTPLRIFLLRGNSVEILVFRTNDLERRMNALPHLASAALIAAFLAALLITANLFTGHRQLKISTVEVFQVRELPL